MICLQHNKLKLITKDHDRLDVFRNRPTNKEDLIQLHLNDYHELEK